MSHRIVLIPGDGIGPEVAAEYADVPFQDMQIDDLSVRLARHPSDFDILLSRTCTGTSSATCVPAWSESSG